MSLCPLCPFCPLCLRQGGQGGQIGLWDKSLNEELEAQLLQKILDLWLQNKTQEEIAKELGFKDHTPINTKLKKINEILVKLWQNTESDIDTKYQFLNEKVK